MLYTTFDNNSALFVNYDVKTDPNERSLAYTGEDETLLDDLIFIDTRVMFNLTVAIIDYELPLDEAKKILLSKGRVEFDLEKIKQNQQKG